MNRHVCIHGHFYQPPRENPWLEAIELQDSAGPYHDWNERITAECYGPNTAARILDDQHRIAHIVNNYARMSFNFGPTLLSWMERHSPETYHAILEADKLSQRKFSGHGSAIAQAYNHLILPLANTRDKYTQIIWGIRDFEHRFGRAPEGMWLPECAVDVETLDIVAAFGIRFTILAPHQAARVRALDEREWQDVSGGRIDPTMPYEILLPTGRTLNIFFYDGPISRAIAFEHLLTRGDSLADRLLDTFADDAPHPQLVHIATDGETYGHHHRHGEMGLAYALYHIESNNLARLTNYAEFLDHFPPTHEVQIHENSSWSCVHGVERWRADCGCNSGGHPHWHQRWREPLRDALDWLRDQLAPIFEKQARPLLRDPWAARDDYIEIILDRSDVALDRFLARHADHPLTDTEKTAALKLLEMQRHAQLMFTSCGWFFDEVSGLETVQILQYAARAMELSGADLEPKFLDLLKDAPSNLPAHVTAHHVYEQHVKPATVSWERIGTHHAVHSLFESLDEPRTIGCYRIEPLRAQRIENGPARLAFGRIRITSELTQESAVRVFAALDAGHQNLLCGARADNEELLDALQHANDSETVLALFEENFPQSADAVAVLFRDEQQALLRRLLDSARENAEAAFRAVYEQQSPLLRHLTGSRVTTPRALRAAADFVINTDLRRELAREDMNPDRVLALVEEGRRWQVEFETQLLAHVAHETLNRLATQWQAQPTARGPLTALATAVEATRQLPFEIALWRVQNLYYDILQRHYVEQFSRSDAQVWVTLFLAFGEKLRMRVRE